MFHRRSIVVLALIALLAVVALGCPGKVKPTETADEPPQPDETGTTEATTAEPAEPTVPEEDIERCVKYITEWKDKINTAFEWRDRNGEELSIGEGIKKLNKILRSWGYSELSVRKPRAHVRNGKKVIVGKDYTLTPSSTLRPRSSDG